MLVDGKKIQNEIKEDLRSLIAGCDKIPTLGIVLVGDDPASEKFVDLKNKFGEDIGIDVLIKILPEAVTQDRLEEIVNALDTDGVVVQLPLPNHLDENSILSKIPKDKDVDQLNGGEFVAPVAGAVFEVLDRHGIGLQSKKIVVVGEGVLVGKPVSEELVRRGLNYDLITLETPEEERLKKLLSADVVITGAGDPHFIKKDMVREGVVIIDAGTSEKTGKLEGDVCPSCERKAELMTPVPGGIGPITIAILFRNLIQKCIQ